MFLLTWQQYASNIYFKFFSISLLTILWHDVPQAECGLTLRHSTFFLFHFTLC